MLHVKLPRTTGCEISERPLYGRSLWGVFQGAGRHTEDVRDVGISCALAGISGVQARHKQDGVLELSVSVSAIGPSSDGIGSPVQAGSARRDFRWVDATCQ